MRGYINFEENGYENLSKEFKRELKYAAGNIMQIQLRQMVDQSVETFTNFFKGFNTFSQLRQKQQGFTLLRTVKTIPTDFMLEKDKIRLAKEEEDRQFEAAKLARLAAKGKAPARKKIGGIHKQTGIPAK